MNIKLRRFAFPSIASLALLASCDRSAQTPPAAATPSPTPAAAPAAPATTPRPLTLRPHEAGGPRPFRKIVASYPQAYGPGEWRSLKKQTLDRVWRWCLVYTNGHELGGIYGVRPFDVFGLPVENGNQPVDDSSVYREHLETKKTSSRPWFVERLGTATVQGVEDLPRCAYR